MALVWRRVMLKLSGEALAGPAGFGIDTDTVGRYADDIVTAVGLGATVGVVVGGGAVVVTRVDVADRFGVGRGAHRAAPP